MPMRSSRRTLYINFRRVGIIRTKIIISVNKFSIEITEIHWLFKEDIQADLCAHGKVKVEIGDELIAGIKDDEDWTISATALFLLRTLDRNHTKENQVGEHLIPCCGHFFVFNNEMEEVYVGGCSKGIDWEVIHENGNVKFKTETGKETLVEFDFYKTQVIKFVDKVEQFYVESGEKKIPEDEFDRNAYLEFWNEWKTRRNKWN
ncbi:hypothetical protein GCM10028861_24490 [Flavobacterium koreense]